MFVLSSLHRLRRYTGLTDTPENNRKLTNFLLPVSREIQRYISRELESKSRTEYFNVDVPNRLRFFPQATPVTSITSVDHDSTGLFSGSESSLTDFYPGVEGRSIVLDYPVTPAPRALKVVYTGGEATHGTQSTFTVSSISGFAADKYVFGSSSGAWGIIESVSGTTMVVENLYGQFEAGETLNEADSEGVSTGTGDTCTLTAITAQSLAEKIPEYALATEMQIKYMTRRSDTFELASVFKEGQRYRERDPKDGKHTLLQSEVRSLLQPFLRYI